MKRIYFVRHGEAEGNVGKFSQLASTPLTETGRAQAQVVAKRFTHVPITAVLASHMDRAQDTAKVIASEKGLTVETTEFFHEWIKPTSILGLSHSSPGYLAYMAEENEQYTNPDWRYEDGENFSDVLARVTAGVGMLEGRAEDEIVLVSHGRLLRFLTSYLLHQKELTATIEQQTAASMRAINTGITVFEYRHGVWKLITWNDHAHFAE